ncbi:MAG: hypothetical protein H0T73_04430 [Ardenticatenales bacterium]|nr:hypothetical protein [Ardenticatenales bacterium]
MRNSIIFMAAIGFFLRDSAQAEGTEPHIVSASPSYPAPSSTFTAPRVYLSTNIVQHMELSDALAAPGQIVLRP